MGILRSQNCTSNNLITLKPRNLLSLGPSKIVPQLRNPQIASVIVCSKWDRMLYNTVLTAEKRRPQIMGAQIAGVYCRKIIVKVVFDK